MTAPATRPAPIAGLGPVMQLAFVPADIDAAARYWIETMGVGPFFRLDHVRLNNTRYLGQPVEVDFSMLLAYWGDIQIELIQQHNDAPSIYKTWRDCGHDGLHHVCVLVNDFAAARATCIAAGATMLQEAEVPGGGAVFYAETGGGPGSILEVLRPSPASMPLFGMMRDAARDWDGSNPIRGLG